MSSSKITCPIRLAQIVEKRAKWANRGSTKKGKGYYDG